MSLVVSSDGTSESAVLKSKYLIAWKNKSAKYQFLNATMNNQPAASGQSRFQRNTPTRRSLPGYSRTEGPVRYGKEFLDNEDESEFEKRDLSVPGTPVSSRHVMSQKFRNHLAEKDKREKDAEFESKLQDSDDPLLKFIESMKKLAAMKRADLEQGIVREPPKPMIQTPPSPLPQSKFGYHRMGSWNGDSNLRSYTPLFQRSMTVKLSSMNMNIPKPSNPVDDKLSTESAAGPGSASASSLLQQTHSTSDNQRGGGGGDWDRPNLPKPPTSLIINSRGAVEAAEEERGESAWVGKTTRSKQRSPLKRASLSNADTFHEIRNRLER